MRVLVTGANGFIGKHMCLLLSRKGHEVFKYDLDSSESDLLNYVKNADAVIHLAGINRPLSIEEFYDGNANFTKKLVDLLKANNKNIPIIMSSSIQASLDNDYGKSKKMGEDYLFSSKLPVYVFRLANVFGKWCRPNYNSASATFCYNIAHDLEVFVRDPEYVVHYNYVEDICDEMQNLIENKVNRKLLDILYVKPEYLCSLGKQVQLLKYFKTCVESQAHLPILNDEFELKLFKTFLFYLSDEGSSFNFAADNRGFFEELYKSKKYGQISLNMAYPGITKGGHYHTYKKEIFYVVDGHCLIRQRNIHTDQMVVSEVEDKKTFVDILPEYTHEITNIGRNNSYTLMWISEVYSDETPDTLREPVQK